MLPTTLPGSCKLKLDIEFWLHTQLHPFANLTELCLVTAAPTVTRQYFNMDSLPCLPGLRSLVVIAKSICINWLGTAALPMLQSLTCVSKDGLSLKLGSELHHRFTGRLSLATFGQMCVSHTNLHNWHTYLTNWSGESLGLHPDLCNSMTSFCALGIRQLFLPNQFNFDNYMRSLANARRQNGGREWAPKLGRICMHEKEWGQPFDVMVTDAEGLEWVSTQYLAMCHQVDLPLKGVRNVDIEWDS